MKKTILQNVFALIVFFAVLFSLPLISMKIQSLAEQKEEKPKEVPIIRIYLGDTTLDEIKSGDKHTVYGDNTVTVNVADDTTAYNNVELHGRGNTTWFAGKIPFQIKFDEKVSFLGMPAEQKWVFLANIYDPATVRNDLAVYLEKMLDVANPMDGRFVELDIDNEYQGIYYVMPKIEIAKNRVSLVSEYGIIMELENLRPQYEEEIFEGLCGDIFVISDAVDESNSKKAAMSFVGQYDELYFAAKNKDFEKVSELADVDSFAKHFLLSEFSANPDAYSTSIFFYKDDLDDVIHMGPGWDYDLAFGDKKWDWGWRVDEDYSPYNTMTRRVEAFGGKKYNPKKDAIVEVKENKGISKLFYYLIDIPEFRNRVKAIYQEKMSGKADETTQYLNELKDFVYSAVKRSEDRWGIDEFDNGIEYLIDWTTKRFDHFEQTYGASAQDDNL